jgi:hypothetical protein
MFFAQLEKFYILRYYFVWRLILFFEYHFSSLYNSLSAYCSWHGCNSLFNQSKNKTPLPNVPNFSGIEALILSQQENKTLISPIPIQSPQS